MFWLVEFHVYEKTASEEFSPFDKIFAPAKVTLPVTPVYNACDMS